MIETHKPELLAPAGDLPTLRIAIRNGADAVYFGAQSFNARARASNFDDEEMAEAVDFAHLYSARAYLTLNTLVLGTEMEQVLEVADKAARLGIDALILQDVGLARRIRLRWPDLPLFASTQLSIGNEPGIRAAKDLGLGRIILPRELPAEAIRRLTAYAVSIGLETEVFIHGALCVGFSGQCLLSAIQGGRSANRGACAQPCRIDYSLSCSGFPAGRDPTRSDRSFSPRLSLKDLSLYEHVRDLGVAGVTSLKIEGRLRSPAYVGTVVRAYRRMLDGQPDPEDPARILLAFNRGGSFTDGFYTGRRGAKTGSGRRAGSFGVLLGPVSDLRPVGGWMEVETEGGLDDLAFPAKGDVLAVRRETEQDVDVGSAPIGLIERTSRGFRIRGFHPDALRTFRIGDNVFRMTDEAGFKEVSRSDLRRTAVDLDLSHDADSEGGTYRLTATCRVPARDVRDTDPVELTAEVVRGADEVPVLPPARVAAQLSRMGNTPFRSADIRCHTENTHLATSSLNGMRRDVLDELRSRIISLYRRRGPENAAPNGRTERAEGDTPSGDTIVTAHYWQWPAEDRIACGADRYLLPYRELAGEQGVARLQALFAQEPECRVSAIFPPALSGVELDEAILHLERLRPFGVDGVCSRTMDLHGMPDGLDRGLEPGGNLLNLDSLAYHASMGVDRACVSHEADLATWRALLGNTTGTCRVELPVYGRIGAMFSFTCVVGKNECADPSRGVCRQGSFAMTDRKGNRLPLVCHPGRCTMDVLSARPENHLDWLRSLTSSDRNLLRNAAVRVSFSDETEQMRFQWVDSCREAVRTHTTQP